MNWTGGLKNRTALEQYSKPTSTYLYLVKHDLEALIAFLKQSVTICDKILATSLDEFLE